MGDRINNLGVWVDDSNSGSDGTEPSSSRGTTGSTVVGTKDSGLSKWLLIGGLVFLGYILFKKK